VARTFVGNNSAFTTALIDLIASLPIDVEPSANREQWLATQERCGSARSVTKEETGPQVKKALAVRWQTMLYASSRADNNGHADDYQDKGDKDKRGLFCQEPLADDRWRA